MVDWTGKSNGKGIENATEKDKLYQIHINLMIFFFFSKDTLSVSFTFAGKVQQCLVTGSK